MHSQQRPLGIGAEHAPYDVRMAAACIDQNDACFRRIQILDTNADNVPSGRKHKLRPGLLADLHAGKTWIAQEGIEDGV